jgi:hypothetical protein
MADQTEDIADALPPTTPRRRRILRRTLAGLGLALLAVLAIAWFQREELAGNLIQDQLDKLGLAATYDIESIGPRRQVLVNVVVGDPAHPDLTIERVETSLVPRWPLPAIDRITLIKPRLYGTYVDGKLSFGALDKLLFEQPPQEEFECPDLYLRIDDARALIEGDLGAVGLKAEGEGNLRSGFSAILAATAPHLRYGGCAADGASLYGTVSIDSEKPGFDGPLRLASLDCPDAELAARGMTLQMKGRADRRLAGLEGEAKIATGQLAYAGNKARGLDGSLRYSLRDGGVTASYDLGLEAIDTPQAAAASLALEGSLRLRDGLSRIEIEAEADGEGLRPGPLIDDALAGAAKATGFTMVSTMIEQVRSSLAREGRGSTLHANFTVRSTAQGTSLVVPEARWRGTGGDSLLAISRLQISTAPSGAMRFGGNFTTGGRGLPRIAGRMERGPGGDTQFRLRMAEYRVADSSLELPELVVTQSPSGLRFAGNLLATGPIPGGRVERLALPIEGSWSASGALALWNRCAAIGFDRLQLASAVLAKRTLRLCPSGRGPVFASSAAGSVLAGTIPGLDLAGTIGASPIALRAESLALNYPGETAANEVAIQLGAGEAPSRFLVGRLTLDLSRGIGGRFERADTFLGAVPLDVLDAQGNWRFLGLGIRLDGASFKLQDRIEQARFDPLVARGAWLNFAGSRITAGADLREPRSDRVVANAAIAHDLNSGAGHADLTVAGLTFDDQLQPDRLSMLAQGVVANVFGTVTGKGRIDWDAAGVTSSGDFTTSDLDFAAAFGPVEGVSGTIHFTDLLGLVTAPEQVLTIRSFNPGIPVDEGHLTYEIRPGYEMVVHGGVWPFLGGSLILEPTSTRLAEEGTRHFTLRLLAIDAAQFVQRMELANISATGRFDGRVPLVFDENGGRLVDGYLVSRPPGGNLSYVGALTYEEMNPIAEFAFDALRSLDFTRMEVALNGSLTGEIVTNVRFDGVTQGEGATQNLITKQIARLPIRFNVNIKAPFYQLITGLKQMYDPAYIRDPRELGLIDAQGNPIPDPTFNPLPGLKPEDLPPGEAPIQSPDSEDVP